MFYYYLAIAIKILIIIISALIADMIARKLILKGVRSFITRTKVTWDDVLLEHRVFVRIAHLVPALVVYMMVPIILSRHAKVILVNAIGLRVFMVVMCVLAIDSLLNAIVDICQRYEFGRRLPIRGLSQVVKLVLYVIAGIFILSLFIEDGPLGILAGMGAMTAVTMLVFKDAILGFVAGIQLSANKMVRIGDWIEMPKFGADGDVIDITLTTVKVQNWDKTISTIPAYSLISDSFKNWRGMSEADGRRIKRSIYVDMNTIKFCTDEMLTRFKNFQCLSDYIGQKQKDIAEYNTQRDVSTAESVNGRKLTNIGTFRAYITSYLREHPMISKDMTLMVRQLEPTPMGLPMQIYVFCTDKRWVFYEGIQSDIFDHILAVAPEFGLRMYQQPAGSDFNSEFIVRSAPVINQ